MSNVSSKMVMILTLNITHVVIFLCLASVTGSVFTSIKSSPDSRLSFACIQLMYSFSFQCKHCALYTRVILHSSFELIYISQCIPRRLVCDYPTGIFCVHEWSEDFEHRPRFWIAWGVEWGQVSQHGMGYTWTYTLLRNTL